MKLVELINQVFTGDNFNGWINDETFPLQKLKELGHPYSLACIFLDNDSVVAVDTGNMRQREYIENNLETKYILDASVFPREMKTMSHGLRNVYFAKEHIKVNYTSNLWQQFTINAFKENGNIAGSPVNGEYSWNSVSAAFNKIREKIADIRFIKEINSLENNKVYKSSSIGSFFAQVDFLKNDPYIKLTMKSEGFSIDELETIVNAIHKNTRDQHL